MKRVLVILALCGLAASVFGIGVDVTELKSASTPIVFQNYTGPLTIIQTDFDIRGIGRSMADLVSRGKLPALYLTKYSAIHAVATAEPGKYSADIISIDKDSSVDHIDNVRRIVSAYLGRLYSYSRKDCDTLALFVSYYNAAYRGNLSYFTSKYKTVVIGYLDPAKVGISTKYYEWPGATQLVIPLSDKATGADVLGALSSTELTSKAVTEQLKAQADKGIPERQAMVDLKEKEVTQGEKKVEQQAKALEQQKAQTAAQEKALAAEQQKAAAITDQQAKAEKDKELAAAQQQIAQQKADQQTQSAQITAEQGAIETKKAEIAAEKKDIQADQAAQAAAQQPERTQQSLEQKSADLAQREAAVTQREEAVRRGETDASIYAGWLYYLKIKEYLTGGHYNNEIMAINAATGKIEVKSPFVNICGRKYDIFKEGVVLITHKGDHSAGHYLSLFDLKTLQPKATGTDTVFFRSFVEVRDNLVYAILNRGDAYYLGAFDADMKTVAVSKDKVDADSFISFFGDLIYINSQEKKILALKKADLSTSSVIEP